MSVSAESVVFYGFAMPRIEEIEGDGRYDHLQPWVDLWRKYSEYEENTGPAIEDILKESHVNFMTHGHYDNEGLFLSIQESMSAVEWGDYEPLNLQAQDTWDARLERVLECLGLSEPCKPGWYHVARYT